MLAAVARAARRPQVRALSVARRRVISLGAAAPRLLARRGAATSLLNARATPLLNARRSLVTKTTTGIVGLPVDPVARDTLIALNEKLLEEVKQVPETAEYRKSIEATCNYRLKCLREHNDEATLEELINMGQLEELIESQTEELGVLAMYVEQEMWKVIAELDEPEMKLD